MAAVLFDDEWVLTESTTALLSNRGFLYGDGFFETITIREQEVFFLESHLERALHAMQVLHMHSTPWNVQRLKHLITKLWIENKKPREATIKWIVWRDSEGLYAPSTKQNIHYLLELKNFRSAPSLKEQVYLASSVNNVASVYSSFKRLSALHYVLAGIEKTNRAADELVLTDQSGHLSEACSSGLFWIMEDTLYTPSLDTGCVEGVLRKNMLNWCRSSGIACEEIQATVAVLHAEATVFTANIAGFSLIGQLEGLSFQNNHPLYERLKKELFSPAFSQSL